MSLLPPIDLPTASEQIVRRLEMRLLRQTRARHEAENLLEAKSLALYRVNASLQRLTDDLESEVAKQTSELKIALEQAHIATKAKDAFLANLSHEVRTPLNAIIGLAQLVQRTDLSPEQQQYLRLIDSSAVNLMTLLNDILDFSKIESGQLTFQNVRFDLLDWIEQTTGSYAIQAQSKQLQFITECDAPNLPQFVVGDPHRLRQVLTNLLTNALKFTATGQIKVHVRQALDQTQLMVNEIRLMVTVSDTGIGVPIDQQSRIFDAFVQADASITRTYGGTGLGLTICARLVSIMKGQISIVSQPGVGSQFSFSVVLERAHNALQLTNTAPSTRHQLLDGLKVLVAEDHPINQLLMGKLLGRLGAQVVFANNGLIATEILRDESFNLIFMDIQMPIMGGFEATQHIREYEKPDAKRTPIIALTANAMPGDKEHCLRAGMDAYVSKPVSETELLLAVEEALKMGIE
jgi:signal transduction histidine kinase/ActR/RegA family two-component response regulator